MQSLAACSSRYLLKPFCSVLGKDIAALPLLGGFSRWFKISYLNKTEKQLKKYQSDSNTLANSEAGQSNFFPMCTCVAPTSLSYRSGG